MRQQRALFVSRNYISPPLLSNGQLFCVDEVFVPKGLRGKAKVGQETIQQLLDENDQLVRCITEYMQKGRAVECVQYQQILHRNLVYLATLADASPEAEPAETPLATSGGGSSSNIPADGT